MKKIVACILLLCLLCGCAAAASAKALPYGTGTAIPEGGFDVSEPAELVPFLGKTVEECKAYIEEKGITITGKTKFFSGRYTAEDGSSVLGIRKIDIEEKGCSLYGFQYDSDFSDLTEEMIADGWVIDNKQFEGGHYFWWLKNTKGDATYSMFLRTDGFEIFYMTLEVDNLDAHFAAQQQTAE